MVRSSAFNANVKRALKNRTIKEAPAALSRPSTFQLGHTHSRSMGQVAIKAAYHGLTSSEAVQCLLGQLDSLKMIESGRFDSFSLLRYAAMFILAIRTSSLLSFIILAVEIVLVELWFERRKRASNIDFISQIKTRLRSINKQLLEGVSFDQIYAIKPECPLTGAVDYVSVIRDGRVHLLSSMLVVPGDLLVLEKDGKMKPCRGQVVNDLRRSSIVPKNGVAFISEECPLLELLEETIQNRGKSLQTSQLFNQFQKLWIVLFLVIASLKSNSLWIGPLLLLSSPLAKVISWIMGQAYLSLMIELLKDSDTPYTETALDFDDEFDEEAPPPLKNIHISPVKVIKRIFSLERGRIWRSDLIEALGSISVLSIVDREGSVSEVRKRNLIHVFNDI